MSNLRRNLFSESVFDDLGCHINTHKGIRDVSKNGIVLIRSIKKGGLYHAIASPELNISKGQNNIDRLEHTKTWHSRMGHIGNKSLHYLHKHKLIDIDPYIIDFCENCILGKKTSHSFSKSTYIASKPLEYIHSDLWGLAQVDTIGCRKYFISLIDHYSRKVWVYLLKSKDEAFENFKNWKKC